MRFPIGGERVTSRSKLTKAKFRRRSSQEPNRMKMRKSFILSYFHSIRLMWSTTSELGLIPCKGNNNLNFRLARDVVVLLETAANL